MNNMGIECGSMCKEPDNQSSCKATAKIARKTAAAATFQQGNEEPYDSDSDPANHFSFFFAREQQNRFEARLDNPCAASAVEHCHPLWSTGMIPSFPDNFGPQQTFT